MISETEIVDQWTVIVDCIAKPDESCQALELLTTRMFTEPGCRDLFNAMQALQNENMHRNWARCRNLH